MFVCWWYKRNKPYKKAINNNSLQFLFCLYFSGASIFISKTQRV